MILRKALPGVPLSAIQRLLRQGRVKLDGKRAGPGTRIRPGQSISIPARENEDASRLAEPSPEVPPPGILDILDILYEDTGLLILNKPAGLASHGKGSLETLVRGYLSPKLSPSLSFKPGPLHRLDKPTSGVIAFPVSLEGARAFSAALRERLLVKQYLALVEGFAGDEEFWEEDLERDRESGVSRIHKGPAQFLRMSARERRGEDLPKRAVTRVRPLVSGRTYSLISAEIETGRTHQIRAQAAFHGHPLAGDRKYSGRAGGRPFFLHAWRLLKTGEAEILLPALPRSITAPLPERFSARIKELFPGFILE
ncbi:MAG: RluA family pseudouridine synthase [Treponema sp.]|nr:RluA family pseudouridine synthase [Treponema sp.]